ncbi:MAG: alpha/beta hydrolase [Desulfobacteraceae bacterium]|nr:alpha/beta hydrolase [Desulfobacteraceae bacterium]MBC2755830.1 alpha/beta hydrolase [Desulfobacteraceae bacterium]
MFWKYQVGKFRESYQVLTYDARAQGNSDLSDLPLTLTQHAKDLVDLLTFLKIKKAHFIGISLGARISLAFTKLQPQKVNSLILCSIAMETSAHAHQIFQAAKNILEQNGKESMAEYLLPYLSGSYFSKKEQTFKRAMAKAIANRNKKESLFVQLEAMQTYPDFSELTLPLQIPSLLITGSEDRLFTDSEAERLVNHLGGQWEQIHDTGHSIPIEIPDLFHKIVRKFIESCPICSR